MLEAALNNPALSDAEKQTICKQAQSKGIGVALGVLSGMIQAMRERALAAHSKVEMKETCAEEGGRASSGGQPPPSLRRSRYPDPETADVSEAERLRAHLASPAYQERWRRMVEWERRQQAQAVNAQAEVREDALRRKAAWRAWLRKQAEAAANAQAAVKQSAGTDAEVETMGEKRNSAEGVTLLTRHVRRQVKADGIPERYVEIPPLTAEQHAALKNWNVAAQVAAVGLTTGITAAAGFATGLKFGPSG